MNKLSAILIAATLALPLSAAPALADFVPLKKPGASIVTEGIIVACTFKATKTAAEIIATQVRMAGKAKGNVRVPRAFCGKFLAEANAKAPAFVKAIRARVKADGTTAANDPAVQSARKGKKTETTTTTTSDEDTTTTVTTTVETTTNDNGTTTITETIEISQR